MKAFTAWLTSLFAGDGREVEREEPYKAIEENHSRMLTWRQKREAEEEASRKAVPAKFPPFTIVQTPSGSAYAYVRPEGELSEAYTEWHIAHLMARISKSSHEARTTPVDQWVEVGK